MSLLGFAITAIILFLIIRNLEAVIFWSALCAPAIGTSLINALTYAFTGNYEQAKASLTLLPFLMASLDNVFFTQPDPLYMYVGVVFVLIWTYIIAHYAVKKFGMWALPIIPPMIWGIGLTMPYMREKLMTTFPNFAFLFDFYGIPALILVTTAFFGVCYLIRRRGYSLQRLPMWTPPK